MREVKSDSKVKKSISFKSKQRFLKSHFEQLIPAQPSSIRGNIDTSICKIC